MKKILMISMLLGVIVLTGCDNNRLVCTVNDESISDLKSETKYIFSFKDADEVAKATMTTKVTLDGDYNNETFISNYSEMAKSSALTYNETTGVNATVSNKKNVITLKVEMEASQMSDEDKEEYGLNLNKEQLKKELEEAGYTCK